MACAGTLGPSTRASLIAGTARTGLMACAGLLVGASLACAQDYPVKPVRLIVPFAPGGPVDVLGRALAQHMAPAFGHNVLLDNRPGASGIVAMELVAKSPPDGHVLLLTSGNFTALPAFTPKLPYDPARDFAPVSSVARIPGFLLAVHPSLPVKTVQDLIRLAKTHPGKLNYGSSGTGGVQHLAMALFNIATGTQMTHVLYKGAPPLSIDLMSGQIETAFVVPASSLDFVRSGRMRAIGFSGRSRWNKLPEVPTIAESGVKGFDYFTWYGMWAPAAVPPAIVERVHAEVNRALGQPDVRTRFDEFGFEPMPATRPAEFGRFVETDMAAMRKLARQIGTVE